MVVWGEGGGRSPHLLVSAICVVSLLLPTSPQAITAPSLSQKEGQEQRFVQCSYHHHHHHRRRHYFIRNIIVVTKALSQSEPRCDKILKDICRFGVAQTEQGLAGLDRIGLSGSRGANALW
jgi:hypothetical protein